MIYTHVLPLVLTAENAMSRLLLLQVLVPLNTPQSWHHRVISLVVASAPFALVANFANAALSSPSEGFDPEAIFPPEEESNQNFVFYANIAINI